MLGNLLENVNTVPFVKPMHNTMSAFDMLNGQFVEGARGEMILNGGSSKITGTVGFTNTYKSSVDNFFVLNDYLRYQAYVIKYCSEGTSNHQRINKNVSFMTHGKINDISLDPRFKLSSIEEYKGAEFFTMAKDLLQKSIAAKKFVTTPFLDSNGNKIKVRYPVSVSIDSLTQFSSGQQEKKEKTDIGSSDRNAINLTGGLHKDQMINELPHLLGVAGAKFYMTAHIGDEFSMGEAPGTYKEKKMSYLKEGYKIKGCPDSFLRLTNDTHCLLRVSPHRNQLTKEPEYPSSEFNYNERDCELSKMMIIPLRGKNGPSGDPHTIMLSQYQSVLPDLTNIYMLRETYKYWGLNQSGNFFSTYFLPDIKMSRTKVRDQLQENPLLARAVEITADLKLAEYNASIPKRLLCTAEELYESLKDKYDWNELLNTRRYWLYEHLEADALPFLSIYDLLRMREGTYTPYWKK